MVLTLALAPTKPFATLKYFLRRFEATFPRLTRTIVFTSFFFAKNFFF
jgi:hypothetical protein